MLYHAKSKNEVLKDLASSEKGLNQEEVKIRLQKYGLNEIKEKKEIHPVIIFLNQFKSFIVGILIVAVILSILIHEYVDASVIGIILILNAIMGFVQEYKAEKAIEALKKMASLKAVVVRNGKEQEIDAKNLVPGDIILLETGEKIPADSRLIESLNLQTQEAALTGESLPNKKDDITLRESVSVADRVNMVFSGTIITKGRGKAVVTSTGMNTEFGKIAQLIQKHKPELTPLQKKLRVLGEYIGAATIMISVLVFVIGILIGFEKSYIFLIALSLAVAAIPEGLPAVVTVALSLGTRRMVKRNALIRKLASVETLGSTTVICTDKTGTLTLNQMTVRKIYANNKIISVSGRGYETKGRFYTEKEDINPKEIDLLLRIGALCNDSKLSEEKIIGDPTEGALIVSAAKAGIIKKELEAKNKRTNEIQFSSERKRMSTQHTINNKTMLFTKGAPDILLEHCDRIYKNGKVERLTRIEKRKILEVNKRFAHRALRVLGFAYKQTKELKENDMVFVGLQGMIDPPREETKEAIQKCKTAGIKVVMITGDFKETAKAIAREVGLTGLAVDGKEIDNIHDLEEHVEDIAIYARVDPKHKVKILDALRKKGHIVAMTGDGVNDAPALKEADIGISMGITGTDVAKEASDMILTDDNFSSIVSAVKEGRGIYDNIRKFINYLLSCNLAEVAVIFFALIFKWPLPLIATQILWLNLVTDGFPALALGVDPPAKRIMQRKPKSPKENIMNKKMIYSIIILSVLMTVATLAIFIKYKDTNLIKAQTMAFTSLVIFEIARLQMIRSSYHTKPFENKWLIAAVASSLILQMLVIYTPLSSVFKTTALQLIDWGVIIGALVIIILLGWILQKILITGLTKKEDSIA